MKLKHLVRGCLFSLFILTGTAGALAQSLTVSNGLQLWLRADAGVTTNATGGVTQWLDQSGNANNAVQGTDAMAPLLVNGALNTRPVLRFDGTDDFLDVADSDSLSFAGDISSFFVVRFEDFATYRAVWAKTVNNLPAPTDIYTVPNSGVLRIYRGDGTSLNLGSVDSAQALRASTYLVLGFDVTGGRLTHYLNNTTNGSGTITTNTADGNTALKIGTRADSVTRHRGDLAELLIYNRALSLTERSNVFNYLQTKYNLLNLLPTVSLAVSPSGSNVTVGTNLTLTATAADLDGTIAQVELFANGSLLGTATKPPYSIRVIVDSAGPLQFTARATDDKGAAVTSAAINMFAGPPGTPVISVTNGLQLWLTADAGVTAGSNGAVSQWADQSGRGNHALQSDSNLMPLYTNGAVNGRPAVRFDGADDFLEIADSDSLSITGDITTLFVVRFSDFGTYRAIWAKTTVNLPAPTDFYALPNDGRLRLYRGNGVATGIQFVDSARPFAAGSFLLGGFDQAGTAVRHFYNGLLNGTGAITVPLADGNGSMRIGSRADGVTKMKGEIAEIVIYNRSLSTAERRSMDRYLTDKYGLPALVTPTNSAPTITITGPASQTLTAPTNLTFSANAVDSDGAIVSVQFFADGTLTALDTTSPYSSTLNVPFGGSIVLTAVATDNLGAQGSAGPIKLCAQGPGRPTGLVGYWTLDGNANALIGANGIMVSNPVPAMDRNGVAGGALFFDGALQQRVEVPGGGGLNGSRRGTVSLWVKWIGTQDTGFGNSAGAVLGRQQDGTFSDDIINLNNANPDLAVLQWRQTSAGTVNITGSAAVGTNAWHHIAVTFTETNSQMFLDGISEGTGTGGALHDNTLTPLAIGAWTGGGGAYATAFIDDVAIWNRVLEQNEIQDLALGFSTPLTLLRTPDCLSVVRSGTNAIVAWGSGAILQSATNVVGPYSDVMSAASPYRAPLTGAQRFYRLRSP